MRRTGLRTLLAAEATYMRPIRETVSGVTSPGRSTTLPQINMEANRGPTWRIVVLSRAPLSFPVNLEECKSSAPLSISCSCRLRGWTPQGPEYQASTITNIVGPYSVFGMDPELGFGSSGSTR